VIFMTALSETTDKVEGFEAGGVDYITKPFQVAEMLARVETHLKLAAMKRQLATQNTQLREYREGLERTLAERVAQELRFLESLDRINSAVRGASDLEQMMSDLLDTVLSIFDCDRAWLVFPCDPQAASWRCPMEKTRPEYPGTFTLGIEQPVDEQVAQSWRILRAANGPVAFGPGGDYPLAADFPSRFGIQSFIAVVAYPKIGLPWLFGLHQCSYPRVWSTEDQRLFKEVGRRTADALSSLLAYRNLQKNEREFRSLAEHSPDLISRVDRDGRYLYVSPAVAALTGLPPESFIGHLIGETRRIAGHAVDAPSLERLRDAVRLAVDTGAPQVCEVYRTVDSTMRFVEYRLTPELDADGKVASVLCIGRDLTERKRSEEVQKKLNRSLRLLSNCNELLIHADDESRLLADVCRLVVEAGDYLLAWVSVAEQDDAKSVRPIAKYGRDQGYLDSVKITWADSERGWGPTGTTIRTGEPQLIQDMLRDPRVKLWKPAMVQRGYRSSASLPLKDARGTFGALTIFAGAPDAFIAEEVELLQELAADLAYGMRTLRTRTEHRAAEEKLAFLAHHDPLTQLPNRLLLRDRFEQAIAAAQRKQARVAMMFLDLDNFKEINDSLGHAIGDHLLVGVVERLRSCIRASDTVSREGGDEFVVLLTDVGDFDGAARVALQILAAIEQPFDIEGNPLHTTVSIGISFYPADGKDFETLRKNSDVALFHAKDSGRNTYRFFDEEMNREAISRLQTQANLRAALKNDEFRLHYQPQVRLSDGRVVGAEALIRWQRPDGELVAPGNFIAAAEQSGLIIPIGQWVLNEACRQAVEWRRAGLPDLVVSVNLSAVQFRRGNILQAVPMALKRSGLPAELLELELTESVLLNDTEAALEMLRALKKIGVKLAIDDFGTGYSSLSYIKRLAVHRLKIDGSFVRGLGASAEDAAIVRAIIQLGHTLELEVVAEGVESDAQLAFLRQNGCDQVQGYLLGRPVAPDKFVSAALAAVRAPLDG